MAWTQPTPINASRATVTASVRAVKATAGSHWVGQGPRSLAPTALDPVYALSVTAQVVSAKRLRHRTASTIPICAGPATGQASARFAVATAGICLEEEPSSLIVHGAAVPARAQAAMEQAACFRRLRMIERVAV